MVEESIESFEYDNVAGRITFGRGAIENVRSMLG